jgi:hypothetical protein
MSIFYKYNYFYYFFFKNKKKTNVTIIRKYIKIYKDPFHISFSLISLIFLTTEIILVKAKIKPLIKTQIRHQLFNHAAVYNGLLLK